MVNVSQLDYVWNHWGDTPLDMSESCLQKGLTEDQRRAQKVGGTMPHTQD